MNEMILLKLGELVLKGLNRKSFESRLLGNIHRRLRPLGKFRVYSLQSTVYVEPLDGGDRLDGAYEAMKSVFGIVGVSRAFPCEKTAPAIVETALRCLQEELSGARTFKVESKRADKSFPMTSIQLSQYVGGRLHEAFPHLTVDVKRPQLLVNVEVRDYAAYVHAGAEAGAGGLPVGVNGSAVTLLSGGIDSPVASFMIAKRGVELLPLHFFSYPYTSPQAKEKVITLSKKLARYCGRMTVHIVPFTRIQEEIRKNCPEELFTLVMRRFMMRIAQRIAEDSGCSALVTGESLGQVASQTMAALAVTGSVCRLPVLRPVVGMDKEEIVSVARRIGTFETSILPYEDCCTVFTPRHPKTRPVIAEVEEAELALSVDELIGEALEKIERVVVKP